MLKDAVWITKPYQAEIRPLEVRDEPYADEVQIDIKACGVCAWDSHLWEGITGPGDPPYPIGHEAVGVITKVGSLVQNFKPGDKVFVGSSSGGGYENLNMCQAMNQKASGVAKIPDDVTDFASYVFEPTCCVVNLLYKTNILPGDRVALVGAGYMGLLTLMGLLKSTPSGEIVVFEKRPERREIARKLGADIVIDPESEEGKQFIEDYIKGGGADKAIDFSASVDGYELATKVIKKQGGTLTIGSWHRREMKFDGTRWHLGGFTVLNLSPMSNPYYAPAIVQATARLIKRGIYTPAMLITHRLNYKDPALNDLFHKSLYKEDGYIKGIITFD